MKKLIPLRLVTCLTATLFVSACAGEPEQKPLPGERISIMDLQKEINPSAKAKTSDVNIQIPPALNNEDWPQAGGYPHHAMQNLAVGTQDDLEQIWRADIGTGGSKSIPLNAKPIVADGKVFTLDTRNQVTAFHDQTGKEIWSQNVQKTSERDPVISGGIAFAGGVLFVTSGYNEALALSPETGEIYWRAPLTTGSRAAPTIQNGRVFITLMNNNVVALNAADGKEIWEYEGVGETTALLGAASPAADDQIVVPALSSGDILALRFENGATVWEDSLANALRLGGMAGLSDIRGLPVIAGERVLAVSFGGKMAAFDKNNGARLWQRSISSRETPWVSGNVVYVLTPEQQIVAMDVTNGDIIWVSELAKYENAEKRKGILAWSGPIMINGKLLVTGTGGRVVELDAISGQETKRWNAGGTITNAPIAAGGKLYILTEDGTLSAWR